MNIPLRAIKMNYGVQKQLLGLFAFALCISCSVSSVLAYTQSGYGSGLGTSRNIFQTLGTGLSGPINTLKILQNAETYEYPVTSLTFYEFSDSAYSNFLSAFSSSSIKDCHNSYSNWAFDCSGSYWLYSFNDKTFDPTHYYGFGIMWSGTGNPNFSYGVASSSQVVGFWGGELYEGCDPSYLNPSVNCNLALDSGASLYFSINDDSFISYENPIPSLPAEPICEPLDLSCRVSWLGWKIQQTLYSLFNFGLVDTSAFADFQENLNTRVPFAYASAIFLTDWQTITTSGTAPPTLNFVFASSEVGSFLYVPDISVGSTLSVIRPVFVIFLWLILLIYIILRVRSLVTHL
jgi:hypothetical protein